MRALDGAASLRRGVVAVLPIDTTEGYEDALFDDGCDVVIEHLEFWRECGYLG